MTTLALLAFTSQVAAQECPIGSAVSGFAEPCMCSPSASLKPLSSASIGRVTRGRLLRADYLESSAFHRKMESDIEANNFYGTKELVGLVERASRRVALRYPGGPRLGVGELSRLRGGDIIGHSSHENGRDVDLGFYMKDFAGVPTELPEFTDVNRAGIGEFEESPVYFDDVRNWLLIEALIEDPYAIVQHVFVARSIRRRLIDTGRRLGASEAFLEKVGRVVMSPHADHPHQNHFHVRIYCSAEDLPRCRDRGPYWPWIPEAHPYFARIVPLPPIRL